MNIRETHMIGSKTREWMVSSHVCPALARHRISLTGISDARLGFQFVRTAPQMSQLMICHGGEGRVLIDSSWRRCAEGMAYLTPPRVLHAYHAIRKSPWQVSWVSFGESDTLKPVIDAQAPMLLEADPRPMLSAIQGLYWESVGAASAAVMEHSVELLQLLYSRLVQPYRRDDRLWRVWSAVDADLSRDWTLQELAEAACMSPEHLRFLRMRKAAALLSGTPDKVEAIGNRVGYGNPFAFSTAFKQCMGMSPAQFRSKNVGA